uniref:C-type lectin domain-containing protein n=1 Tax=Salmo trutta TaxID=8032 RepID=A0A673VUE0_SALTR
MQRKSNFTGLLITALCTWEKAQQYCREKYIDLAFISNQDEVDEFNNISKTDYVWIGLYRDPSHPTEFWEQGQPNNLNGNQDCVDVKNHEMNDKQCTEQYPFLCFDLNSSVCLYHLIIAKEYSNTHC